MRRMKCAYLSIIGLLLGLLMVFGGCEEKGMDAPEEESPGEESPAGENGGGTGTGIGPADPPYTSTVTYPSGLRLDGLVQDGAMSDTYPDPGSNPYGGGKARHYNKVGYFIDIQNLSSAARREKVSNNFTLDEYVSLPERNQDHRAYIDAEISSHTQELRDAWGGPLNLSSTFRGPEYNHKIGGATFSRHQYGDALDVKANDTAMAQDLYNLARFIEVSYLEPADLTITGKNNPWIHIDDRGWAANTSETR